MIRTRRTRGPIRLGLSLMLGFVMLGAMPAQVAGADALAEARSSQGIPEAIVLQADGVVRVGRTATLPKLVVSGERLRPQDTVSTEPGAWALLSLPDGSEVELDEATEVRLVALAAPNVDGTFTNYELRRGMTINRVARLQGNSQFGVSAGGVSVGVIARNSGGVFRLRVTPVAVESGVTGLSTVVALDQGGLSAIPVVPAEPDVTGGKLPQVHPGERLVTEPIGNSLVAWRVEPGTVLTSRESGVSGGTLADAGSAPSANWDPPDAPYEAPVLATRPEASVLGGGASVAMAWGQNAQGQCGTTGSVVSAPTTVPALGGLVAIAGGLVHTLALREDGSVWAWGQEMISAGVSGGGPPHQQPGVADVTAITVIQSSNSKLEDANLVLKNDGTIWTWGTNHGQLGIGVEDFQVYARPIQVPLAERVVAIAGGDEMGLALDANGAVWQWGRRFGYASPPLAGDSGVTPTRVPGLTDVQAIAAGGNYGLALRYDGTVWVWGLPPGLSLTTVTRSQLDVHQVQGLSGVIAIAAGASHAVALRADGTVWAWGKNNFGQLGNGTTCQGDCGSSIPTQLPGLEGITAITSGPISNHSLALDNDGGVYGWGDNRIWQLGLGPDGPSVQPSVTPIPGLANVGFVGVGAEYSLALGRAG